MNGSLIDKFISNKKKDLYEYAKFIGSLVNVENNRVYSTKRELNTYLKGILDVYMESYYYENNEHIDNPVKYFNSNSNYVLKSIMDYFKKENKLNKLSYSKKESFLLFVIISGACYVDFACNCETGDLEKTKVKFDNLLEYLDKNPIIQVHIDKDVINNLFDVVKKNMLRDRKILDQIDNDNYKIDYFKLSNNPVYLKATFNYKIEDLDKYNTDLVNYNIRLYSSKIMEAFLSVFEFNLLKELVSDRAMPIYLFNIDNSMKKGSIIKFFSNRYVKEYTGLLVPYKKKLDYEEVIDIYKGIGIKIVYDYDNIDTINTKNFDNDIILLVNQSFVINNIDNRYNFIKKNIKVVVKNEEEEQ